MRNVQTAAGGAHGALLALLLIHGKGSRVCVCVCECGKLCRLAVCVPRL